MTIWPADHPGRICARCGCEVYRIWVDGIYPPPGTCMYKAPEARHCADFQARCINHLQIAKALDQAPHPDFLSMLDRATVTLDEAMRWRDEFQAKSDAEDRRVLSAMGVS